jgi:hypothetical protein
VTAEPVVTDNEMLDDPNQLFAVEGPSSPWCVDCQHA